MSPPKVKIMEAPAFAVYNKNKNKHKSNKVNKVHEVITIESDVEEISKTCNPMLFSREKKKKKRSATPFAVETNSSVVNENSANTRKKIKVNDVMSSSDVNDTEVESILKKKAAVSTEQHESSREKKQKRGHRPLASSSEGPDGSVGRCDFYASGNSIVDGRNLFAWLIKPLTPEKFFSIYWERQPLHLKRGHQEYYKTLISTQEIDTMLRKNNVHFTENIDVTNYSDGKRETINPNGRAHPNVVWNLYKNGCSVRLLNPQIFIPNIRILNSHLQDYFTSSVGANVYLTPPDSQGFAPHYDDIEAFALQVEGQKRWKLYTPLTEDQILPRFSSKDFKQEELGEPYADVTLHPGDLLYFPRGMIHQAFTVPGYHSLHITVSCYQRNTWGDLLLQLMPSAVQNAIDKDVEYRKGLPRGYLEYMGLIHSEEKSPQRTEFIKKVKSLAAKLIENTLIDGAADQMGKQFIHDTLPPILNSEEKKCTSFENGYKIGEDGEVLEKKHLTLNTKVKLLKAHILRLLMEDDEVRLYYSVDNSFEYHGKEPQFLTITHDLAPAIEYLVQCYPTFVKISELPLDTDEEKMAIADDLWNCRLLATEGPLQETDD
ncbi:ribosomal oxygenase 1 [Periplaneta americana]|uniref:ribosomal oxygenase 1 n=1 Tax=Periplaneta americana TaxID=6978 RepID=UPI0037E811DB